jgi:hypothetical protein
MFGVGSAWGEAYEWKDEYERGVLLYADRGREVSLLGYLGQMADILGIQARGNGVRASPPRYVQSMIRSRAWTETIHTKTNTVENSKPLT